jgi:hypothetical protein
MVDDAAAPIGGHERLPHPREVAMVVPLRGRDPFWDDGKGARRSQRRHRATALLAFTLAIGACGLTAAAWLRELAPLAERLGLL